MTSVFRVYSLHRNLLSVAWCDLSFHRPTKINTAEQTVQVLSTTPHCVMSSLAIAALRIKRKQIKLGWCEFCVPAKSHCVSVAGFVCLCPAEVYKRSIFLYVCVCVFEAYKQGACPCHILRSVCASLCLACVCLCVRFSWCCGASRTEKVWSQVTLISSGFTSPHSLFPLQLCWQVVLSSS